MTLELAAVLITALVELTGVVILGGMLYRMRDKTDADDASLYLQRKRVEEGLREMRRGLVNRQGAPPSLLPHLRQPIQLRRIEPDDPRPLHLAEPVRRLVEPVRDPRELRVGMRVVRRPDDALRTNERRVRRHRQRRLVRIEADPALAP